MSKTDALQKVADFEKRSGGTDWLTITKDDLIRGLRDRINNPDGIDTTSVNLCGPGAFFRWLAIDDPVMYANAVISLWEKNEALIGSRKFKAPYSLRIANPGSTEAVDWVPLASLRDDENTLLSFDSAEGTLSGLTMPMGMEKWFREAGYRGVVNVTNVLLTKNLANIQEADRLRAGGYRVCLLIHGDMLTVAKQSNKSIFPNHWVGLTDAVRVNGANISMEVHSWGDKMRIPENGALAVNTFLKNYYGYVAGLPA